MSRKSIIITTLIVLILAIVGGVYLGLQKSKTFMLPILGGQLPIASSSSALKNGSSGTYGTQGQGGNSAFSYSAGNGIAQNQLSRLTQLSTASVVGYWVASSTALTSLSLPYDPSFPNPIFYVTSQGDVVLLTGQGKEQKISSSQYGRPLSVVGNALGTKALVTFNSGVIALFDVTQNVWISLDGAVSAAFSPDGSSLAFLTDPGTGAESLYMQNISTSKRPLTLVTTLYVSDVLLAWPSPKTIVLLPKQSSLYNAQVWTINLTQKTIQSLVSGRGLGIRFSPNGSTFAYFISKDSTHMLGFFAHVASGNGMTPIPFSTFAQKCAFSSDGLYLFCGVPTSFSQGSNTTLPDSYLENAILSSDELYQIDTTDNASVPILDGTALSLDISHMVATAGTLFFIDHRTQHLYAFSL